MRDLRTLPKGHLHLHLDGSMRSTTLDELAAAAGVAVPPMGHFGGFASFMGTLQAAQLAIDSQDDLARLVTEVVEDGAADGALWMEVSVWPGFLRGRLGSEGEILDLVIGRAHRGAEQCGIAIGIMVAANRDHGP